MLYLQALVCEIVHGHWNVPGMCQRFTFIKGKRMVCVAASHLGLLADVLSLFAWDASAPRSRRKPQ